MPRSNTEKENNLMRDPALRRLATWAALVVAIALVVLKLSAWIATGSVVLLSSAIDALVDMASSIVTFIGVRYAERPPDHDHRFGHGKGEAIAGFTQATVLTGAALVLAFQSAQHLIFPERIEQIGIGIGVILVSLAAAIGLVLLQTWVVHQTGSTAIAADRAHYLTDIAVNIAVLSALGVTRATGWERADPAFALAIAGYMLWSSYKIAMDVLEQLLDRELPHEERERIKETLLACPGVQGVHDLRTRHAGDRTFVELHLEVEGHLSIEEGHAICDMGEAAIKQLFPATIEITAHLEPAGIDDDRLDHRIASAQKT
ncbi:cation diffusion facilitator family transporter [Rhodoblastus sp.]|uniref:cation diffusion facilitator family transporter n=1 Tax=Rhodoblastus sp. TaxID=1962975 RepID=UPI003F998034